MNLTKINIQKLPQHHSLEKEGTLAVLEFMGLTFAPQRLLYVVDVPKGSIRGNHAHHKNKQIILCLQGQIDIKLWNGYQTVLFNLFPHEYIEVGPMIWDTQIYKTGNDIMMSIHSEPFQEEDHITSRELFLQLTRKKHLCFIDIVKINVVVISIDNVRFDIKIEKRKK